MFRHLWITGWTILGCVTGVYVSSPAGSKPGFGDYEMPSVCVFMCAHISLSLVLHKPFNTFIYEDIFIKFAENVYRYENLSVKIFLTLKKKERKVITMF